MGNKDCERLWWNFSLQVTYIKYDFCLAMLAIIYWGFCFYIHLWMCACFLCWKFDCHQNPTKLEEPLECFFSRKYSKYYWHMDKSEHGEIQMWISTSIYFKTGPHWWFKAGKTFSVIWLNAVLDFFKKCIYIYIFLTLKL